MAEKRYQKLEEIPDYAKEIIEDLIKSDIIKGTGEGLNLTEDMLRVIGYLLSHGSYERK